MIHLLAKLFAHCHDVSNIHCAGAVIRSITTGKLGDCGVYRLWHFQSFNRCSLAINDASSLKAMTRYSRIDGMFNFCREDIGYLLQRECCCEAPCVKFMAMATAVTITTMLMVMINNNKRNVLFRLLWGIPWYFVTRPLHNYIYICNCQKVNVRSESKANSDPLANGLSCIANGLTTNGALPQADSVYRNWWLLTPYLPMFPMMRDAGYRYRCH